MSNAQWSAALGAEEEEVNDIWHECPDCRCKFTQPFVCTTCGAQKLYDYTVKSQAEQIEQLCARLARAEAAILEHNERCASKIEWEAK